MPRIALQWSFRASNARTTLLARRDSMPDRAVAAAFALIASAAFGQTSAPPMLDVPAKKIFVPQTASPEIQKLIALPYPGVWNVFPPTPEGWKHQIGAVEAATVKGLPALREQLKVKVEPTTIGGVKAYIVTPENIRPENRNRLLVHVHGGCFASFSGESLTVEPIYMAGFAGYKIIAVDDRVPPDHPYPAALDDAMTAWKALTKTTPPKNMAIFGSSAGGNLTLAMVLRAKMDNVLVAYGANCDQRAKLYTAGRDLKDPLLSPVYGDMSGFPPAILTTGTRDLLLSNTVRVHRKLRQAGVEAVLQVFEGQSHAQYYRDGNAPETQEAFEEIARFFDKHLAR